MSDFESCKPGDFVLVVGTPRKKPYWLAEVISATSHYGSAHTIQNIFSGEKGQAVDYGLRYIIHADLVNAPALKAAIKKTGKTFTSLKGAREFIAKFQ